MPNRYVANFRLLGPAVSHYRVGGKNRKMSSHKEPKREQVGKNGKLELQILTDKIPDVSVQRIKKNQQLQWVAVFFCR